MAVGSFSQSEIYTEMASFLRGKATQLQDRQVTLNRAVRFVVGDIDLRSTKRASALAPNLMDDQYNYTAPADLKDTALIDIRRQVNRASGDRFVLVDETEFSRYKGIIEKRVAIADDELARILKIDGVEGTTKNTINSCNSLTINGTWAVVSGTDASNMTLDSDNYISGSSLNFDTAEGAATAAIENSTMTQVDLTSHDEKGSIFVWVYIPDATDASGDAVTNFILRWGNDSSNYWSRTVTVNNEGLAFYDGWNLLRFDWNGATETGTVAPATIDYIRLTITKPTTFAADTDWRVDDIVSRVGEIYDVIYYSKYGWQNSSGTYLEDATATTDLVNADTDELELILTKTGEFGALELREYTDAKNFQIQYDILRKKYTGKYKTERMKRLGWYSSRPKSPNRRM